MKRIPAAVLGLLLPFGAAQAADPPMDHGSMAPMAMPMTPPGLPAMPSIYGGQADKPGAPVFKNLGSHHHQISTKKPQVQALFDQGVNLIFGFNHAEAIRSFREAARLDPDCAMCWWGIAFALGPNINLPIDARWLGARLVCAAEGASAQEQGEPRRAGLYRRPRHALRGR